MRLAPAKPHLLPTGLHAGDCEVLTPDRTPRVQIEIERDSEGKKKKKKEADGK